MEEKTVWIDRWGSVASAACAVHCMTVSLAPTALALLGLGALAHAAAEWVFYGTAVMFAAVAGWTALLRHRRGWPAAGFALGVVVLSVGRFGEAFGWPVGGLTPSVLGGVMLVLSHLASLWMSRERA